jgi:hypothetical protein
MFLLLAECFRMCFQQLFLATCLGSCGLGCGGFPHRSLFLHAHETLGGMVSLL